MTSGKRTVSTFLSLAGGLFLLTASVGVATADETSFGDDMEDIWSGTGEDVAEGMYDYNGLGAAIDNAQNDNDDGNETQDDSGGSASEAFSNISSVSDALGAIILSTKDILQGISEIKDSLEQTNQLITETNQTIESAKEKKMAGVVGYDPQKMLKNEAKWMENMAKRTGRNATPRVAFFAKNKYKEGKSAYGDLKENISKARERSEEARESKKFMDQYARVVTAESYGLAISLRQAAEEHERSMEEDRQLAQDAANEKENIKTLTLLSRKILAQFSQINQIKAAMLQLTALQNE